MWASIEIWNRDGQNNISNCYLRLDKIIDLKSDMNLLANSQNLTWSSREHNQLQSGDQPINITAGDFRVCDIAHTVSTQDKVYFTMWFGKKTIDPGNYKLEINIFGQWKENQLLIPLTLHLEYEGDNELYLIH